MHILYYLRIASYMSIDKISTNGLDHCANLISFILKLFDRMILLTTKQLLCVLFCNFYFSWNIFQITIWSMNDFCCNESLFKFYFTFTNTMIFYYFNILWKYVTKDCDSNSILIRMFIDRKVFLRCSYNVLVRWRI